MPAVSWANFDPEGQGGIILRAIYPQPRRLTRQQAVAMPLEDLRSIILEYVTRGGQLLYRHGEQELQDASTPPGGKLKAGCWHASVKTKQDSRRGCGHDRGHATSGRRAAGGFWKGLSAVTQQLNDCMPKQETAKSICRSF